MPCSKVLTRRPGASCEGESRETWDTGTLGYSLVARHIPLANGKNLHRTIGFLLTPNCESGYLAMTGGALRSDQQDRVLRYL